MQNIVTFSIPGNPATKKNNNEIYINPKTGKPFVVPSTRYREYEEMALWFTPRLEIDFPINLKCVYYRETKARVDLVNLLEATCDVLVKGHTLRDDDWKIVAGHDGSRILFDKRDPRVEITITKMEG